jgi:predicted ArsR family transcriptional regulator
MILRLLKQSKGLTAQELAAALGVSAVAVRKHLYALQQEELVTIGLKRQPMGRPSYVYVLTAAANALFPQHYRQVLLDLLQDLAASDGEQKVKRLLEARAARQRRGYEERLGTLDADERVRELARLRSEDGYMAALEEDEGAFILRQYNCPVQDVSHRFRQACGCEIDLLRDLLGIKRIERVETLANGDAACTYRIPKRE